MISVMLRLTSLDSSNILFIYHLMIRLWLKNTYDTQDFRHKINEQKIFVGFYQTFSATKPGMETQHPHTHDTHHFQPQTIT